MIQHVIKIRNSRRKFNGLTITTGWRISSASKLNSIMLYALEFSFSFAKISRLVLHTETYLQVRYQGYKNRTFLTLKVSLPFYLFSVEQKSFSSIKGKRIRHTKWITSVCNIMVNILHSSLLVRTNPWRALK